MQNSRSMMKVNLPVVSFDQVVLISDHLARTLAEVLKKKMDSIVLIQWRECAELSVR